MRCTVASFAIAAAWLVAGIHARVAGQPSAPDGAAPVTFNKRIAPLLFKNCAVCHRPGEVAPFSLLTYNDAKKRAKELATVAAERFMPPWKSTAGHSRFVGERRLTDQEIALLAQWVRQGAPEGSPADLPAPPKYPEGWQLGKPDIVVTMAAPYKISADGPDIYRNFVFALDIPKGKYLKAAEYHPSNRRVVHHALLAIDMGGRARKQQVDPADGFKGSGNVPGQLFPGSTGIWTPGRDPMPLPEGLSMPWRSGTDFVLQLHLHPSGKPEVEQSSIGFYLTDQPPRRSMADLLLVDKKIAIPPGERAYHTRDELTLPIDVEVLGLFPHMHLIGKAIKVTAHPPQGEPVALLRIDDWDFNWQTFYQCAEPVKLAAGTRIVLEATHDNSADNIRNPNQPPQRMVWGEETSNEMTVAIIQVVPAKEADFPNLLSGIRRRLLGVVSASPSGR
jgi:mono/diheme cytochrome c family protein